MLAGAAHVDLTPAPGPILQGHYTKIPSTAVLHPLEARAAAFCLGERTVIVLTLDVVGVSRDTTARIRQRLKHALNLHENNVLIATSHTHCAPATIDLLGMSPDPAFLTQLENAAVECATKAAADLRPARLGLGCSAAHFNVNRRPLPPQLGTGNRELGTPPQQFSVNYGGICDKRVRILLVEDLRHRPLACLFHYSCHPTTLPGSQGLISSDYPGVARAAIEHDLGCPALFLPGCFANIRPAILDPAGNFAPATPDQLLSIGHELAAAACRAARSTKTFDADLLDARQTALTLPFASPMTLDQLQSISNETAPAAIAVKWPWAQRTIQQIRDDILPPSETSSMQLLRIGPLSLLSIPGEPVQEIGHALERLATHARHPDLWPLGYTNDMLGYLVTERHKLEGGYEPTAYPFFNRPAPFADEERHITDAAARLLGL